MKDKDKLQYVKVRREGGTRVLSVGKFIPAEWRIVTIKRVYADNVGRIRLEITHIA